MTAQIPHSSEFELSSFGRQRSRNTLELENVEKRYGNVTALSNVNLSVPSGQFVTILGPSGSGKTTLLRMLAGFDVPTSGKIFLNGRDVSRLPPANRSIGMVFQNYALFPHMTVRDNIGYGLKMRNWSRKDREGRVDKMLELVRLGGMGERKPKELSGGQQQRVALVRALAPRPALLLMDEPLGALDRALRIEMAEEIRRLHRELETTTVYVTHDREEALTLSDRILIMRSGRVIADGTPEELYRKPTSAFVAGFFGGHNIVKPVDVELHTRPAAKDVSDFRWTTLADGVAGNPRGLEIAVPVRKLTLKQPDDGNYVRVPASILETLFYGDYVRVTCRTKKSGDVVTAWLDTDGISPLVPGKAVDLFSRQNDSVLVFRDD